MINQYIHDYSNDTKKKERRFVRIESSKILSLVHQLNKVNN